jgi:hypothetical protein
MANGYAFRFAEIRAALEAAGIAFNEERVSVTLQSGKP